MEVHSTPLCKSIIPDSRFTAVRFTVVRFTVVRLADLEATAAFCVVCDGGRLDRTVRTCLVMRRAGFASLVLVLLQRLLEVGLPLFALLHTTVRILER